MALLNGILVARKVQRERLEICGACPYLTAVGTCGTPIVGEKVMHEEKEIELCGCIMAVKTTFKFATCPAKKWVRHDVTIEDFNLIRKMRKLLKKIDSLPSTSIDVEVVREIYAIHNQTHGSKTKSSMCPSCIKNAINDLRAWLDNLE
jgi:hypothetical protein